jgi:hypothetical protein
VTHSERSYGEKFRFRLPFTSFPLYLLSNSKKLFGPLWQCAPFTYPNGSLFSLVCQHLMPINRNSRVSASYLHGGPA